MTRTVFATALAVLAMFAFTAVGSGAPPTGGITATCAIGGESVVSGFKGNPDRVDFFWTTAGGFTSSFGDSEVGGKFGSVATQPTPVRGARRGAVVDPDLQRRLQGDGRVHRYGALRLTGLDEPAPLGR